MDNNLGDSYNIIWWQKIPELMRSLGKGVSEFKKGKDGIENDLNTDNKDNNDHKDNQPAG